MKRFKLYRGSMHEDDNGKYVLYDDVNGLFNSNKPDACAQLCEVRADVKALVDCVWSFRELMLLLVEAGVLTQGSATDLAIQDLTKLTEKVSEHFV